MNALMGTAKAVVPHAPAWGQQALAGLGVLADQAGSGGGGGAAEDELEGSQLLARAGC